MSPVPGVCLTPAAEPVPALDLPGRVWLTKVNQALYKITTVLLDVPLALTNYLSTP